MSTLLAGAGGLAGLLLVTAAASAAPAALSSGCTLSGTTATCRFGYTGAARTFTVPGGTTTVTITLTGASGASGAPGGANGGQGATVTGSLTVTAGQRLTVYAGGRGRDDPAGAAGGFGYGAGGAGDVSTGVLSGDGGGGGGASAIVAGSRALAVAGGGGGAGAGYGAGAGGASAAGGQSGTLLAGGEVAQNVNDGGAAGGQSGPGGGNGGPSGASFGGGGGGGGLHGGSGGGTYTFYGTGGGAGGTDLVPAGGTVQDGTNPGNGQVMISYTARPLVIGTTSLPAAAGGQAYTARLAALGGVPPYTWSLSAGTLPPGLTLDRTTGVISGVPDTAGNYAFTVRVTGLPSGTVVTKKLSIAVSGAVVTALPRDHALGCRRT